MTPNNSFPQKLVKQVISGFAKDIGWTKEQLDGYFADKKLPIDEVVRIILFYEHDELAFTKRLRRKGPRERKKSKQRLAFDLWINEKRINTKKGWRKVYIQAIADNMDEQFSQDAVKNWLTPKNKKVR